MPDDDAVTVSRQELVWLRERSEAFRVFETADRVEVSLLGGSWVWARQEGGPSLAQELQLRQLPRVA